MPTQPVPGNNVLAANLMAKAWNSATELQTVQKFPLSNIFCHFAQNFDFKKLKVCFGHPVASSSTL
jgi:hypothetical protein